MSGFSKPLPYGIYPGERDPFPRNELADAARPRIDAILDAMIEEFYAKIPYAQHLGTAEKVNREYYKRFTIEIILRLRLKRVIDGLTIHYFARTNPPLAKRWCHYTEDEMLHDGLFLADLERVGMSRKEVYETEPLLATKLLQGYFYYGLEHEGVPLASLSSSYFIEYTASRTQEKWLDNIERSVGAGAVKGSRAHVDHDDADGHVGFVWEVLSTFIKTEADVDRIITHLRAVYHLFMMFFVELHGLVIARAAEPFSGTYQTAAECGCALA
ncbi:hypothetical protein PMI42_03106 [Bradyrhizobium sp. YR681]|uniref:iron-containing redox enzyme family protein n=1 Tax=Bradyrhizobium sp. YR681 TaxID=1144344 RepID=UPI0002711BB7|nr:iron-containing redox enzyme family protein [Bradyrhizobium sp. YR681]EJN13533.1 hypothetical protein PMI42_03106 [Bradyrhizobium sp. YR681]